MDKVQKPSNSESNLSLTVKRKIFCAPALWETCLYLVYSRTHAYTSSAYCMLNGSETNEGHSLCRRFGVPWGPCQAIS
jgi:hypothetical protein